MDNLSPFELVKLADAQRDVHAPDKVLDDLLSAYLDSWRDKPEIQAKLREDLQALLKGNP